MTVANRPDGSDTGYQSAGRAWTMVAVLMIANIFSFVDRQVVNLLIDPIRKDLSVSDLQISLLIGPAFAVFFALMALPLGRLVDTRNRIALCAVAVTLWSLMTCLGGFATTFSVLFLARIGVAVGEAALFPAANSLIADSFPPDRRARPVGVYALGISFGSGLAFLFGGAVIALVESGSLKAALPTFLTTLHAWQLVLLVVGAPGLLVAICVALLPEPGRRERLRDESAQQAMRISEVARFMRAHAKLYLLHFLNFSLFVLVAYAFLAWGPTHLARNLGMSRANVGLAVGSMIILTGILGVGIGTTLADRLTRRGIVDAKFRVAGGACLLGAVFAIGLFFAQDPTTFLIAAGFMSVCNAAGIGLGPSALADVAPNEIRGQTLAAYQLVATVVGAGLGPPLVAFLAQTVLHDERALGTSLAIVCTAAFTIGAAGFAAGRKTIHRGIMEERQVVLLAAR